MTKRRRAQRQDRIRALARLIAQARLNLGDATRLGRVGEAAAWAFCVDYLRDTLRAVESDAVIYSQTPMLDELGRVLKLVDASDRLDELNGDGS